MPKGLTKSTKENLIKILYVIKRAPGIHLRAIARTVNLNIFTTSTLIDRYLVDFVDVHRDPYGSKLKTFSIKEGKENTTIDDILRYYETRKRARGR